MQQKESSELLPEVLIEDGVDDRVEGAVDVPEPDEQHRDYSRDAAEGELLLTVELHAEGTELVHHEEGQPAAQKQEQHDRECLHNSPLTRLTLHTLISSGCSWYFQVVACILLIY